MTPAIGAACTMPMSKTGWRYASTTPSAVMKAKPCRAVVQQNMAGG